PHITVQSELYPSETISAPVRSGSRGDEVRLPGGTWVPCGFSCYFTLGNGTIDFWRRFGVFPQYLFVLRDVFLVRRRFFVVVVARRHSEACLALVLEALVFCHQIFERGIARRVLVGDIVLVHLGHHVDVGLADLFILELSGDALAIKLRRGLAAAGRKAWLVGNHGIGDACSEKSVGVEHAGRCCLNDACHKNEKPNNDRAAHQTIDHTTLQWRAARLWQEGLNCRAPKHKKGIGLAATAHNGHRRGNLAFWLRNFFTASWARARAEYVALSAACRSLRRARPQANLRSADSWGT